MDYLDRRRQGSLTFGCRFDRHDRPAAANAFAQCRKWSPKARLTDRLLKDQCGRVTKDGCGIRRKRQNNRPTAGAWIQIRADLPNLGGLHRPAEVNGHGIAHLKSSRQVRRQTYPRP